MNRLVTVALIPMSAGPSIPAARRNTYKSLKTPQSEGGIEGFEGIAALT
jgi:hypothetical protein